MRKLVSDKISMVEVLYKYDPEGRYSAGQTCFCPFHDNENTPAASIYDNDGVESMWCFSEKKLYTSADVIEKLLNKDVFEVSERIWNSMSEVDRNSWLSENSAEDYKDIFSESVEEEKDNKINKELEHKKKQFKSGKIKLAELLDCFIKDGYRHS